MSTKTRCKTVKTKQNTKTTPPHTAYRHRFHVWFDSKLETLAEHFKGLVNSQQFVSSQSDEITKEMKLIREQNQILCSKMSANEANEAEGKVEVFLHPFQR